jgi:hypothetical protein
MRRIAELKGPLDSDGNRYFTFTKFGLFLFREGDDWVCERGSAFQGEFVDDWSPELQKRAGYNQNVYTDLVPLNSLPNETENDFSTRVGADTIVAIRRLKVILPTVYFVFNYLINHPEGRVFARETRAEMTLEEVEFFMLWLETAIAATENEMLCGDSRRVLNCVDPTIWFRSPTAIPVFTIGRPCIVAKALRLLQRSAPLLNFGVPEMMSQNALAFSTSIQGLSPTIRLDPAFTSIPEGEEDDD